MILNIKSTPQIDASVKRHFANLMANDLLEAGVDLTDNMAVIFELRAREYSQRSIKAVAADAVALARRMKQ